MLTRHLRRIGVGCTGLLALAVPSPLASQAPAQTPPAAVAQDDSAPCTPGVKSWVGFGTINVSDAPYSGTWKVTFDQKLSDGRVIHGVTRTLSARSSDGKLLTEASTACSLDENGRILQQLSIHILDPARGTILDWSVGGAVLKLAHLAYQNGQFTSETGISEWPSARAGAACRESR